MTIGVSNRPEAIYTARLELLPCSVKLARAAQSDREHLQQALQARVPEGWPSADLQDALPIYIRQLKRDPGLLPWGLRLIVDRSEAALVGDVGFKTMPDERGFTEIGYGIAPEFRKRRYATEAVHAMVDWAFEREEVNGIVAECLEDNTASIRVLEGLGMRLTGRDGSMLKWELRKPS